jgi:hypothetical protein
MLQVQEFKNSAQLANIETMRVQNHLLKSMIVTINFSLKLMVKKFMPSQEKDLYQNFYSIQ